MEEQIIKCPKCGAKIPLSEAMTHQIEERLRSKIESSFLKREEDLKQRESEIQKREQSITKTIDERLKTERAKVEKEITEKAREKVGLELKDMQNQLKESRDRLEEAQKAELDLRKQQRMLEERQKELELEVARKIDEERKKIREDTTKEITEKHRLKDMEYEKTIGDMKRQIEELQRKAEQGSQQLQGEVLELALEDVLKTSFPYDTVEPVPKGIKGADVLQKVNDEYGRYCGTIIWESKRTKTWSDAWIGKLKNDQRQIKAEIAVIVSITLPQGIKNFSQISGVWVTDYESMVGLATALRVGLIEVARAKQAAVGRRDKMEVLYNYLAGQEFKHRVEAVVESFSAMKEDLESEKRAVQRLWAKREKEIGRVMENMAGMYGEMQAIIGASLPQIESLELKALTKHDDSQDYGDVHEKPGEPIHQAPRGSIRDHILEILKEHPEGMHYKEITGKIKKRGYRFERKDPERSVYIILNRYPQMFQKVKPATYKLMK